MPPQTRRRISAPPDRVYSTPAPLVQKTFKPKKTRIKSYGKKTGVKIPKQETLTQMDYLMFGGTPDGDGEDEEESDGYEDEDAKRKKKRRKTLGDAPGSDSKYHTQRLTQMEWSFMSGSGEENENEGLQPLDSPERPPPAMDAANVPVMGPPRTPRRSLPSEIPSTQSPATPVPQFKDAERQQSPLAQKEGRKTVEAGQADESVKPRKSAMKSSKFEDLGLAPVQRDALQQPNVDPQSKSPAERRSLQERSTNTPIPFNIPSKAIAISGKVPKLTIEDTFENETDSEQIWNSSPPPKPLSPPKTVRFTVSEKTAKASETPTQVSPTIKREFSQSQPHMPPPSSRPSISKMEISDSEDDEDDSDFEYPTDEDALPDHRPGPASQENLDGDGTAEDDAEPEDGMNAEESLAPETCYDEIGLETQVHLEEAERLMSSISTSQANPVDTANDEALEESLYDKGQYMESQRLSTQHVTAMAPRFYGSDAFISLHSNIVTEIVNRSRNHYFRSHPLPETISRLWIYETRPACILKYMIAISSTILPGELEDESGIGNAEFNAGLTRVSKYAYKIRELYELANPLPLAKLQENEWLLKAPKKLELVKPAPLGYLVANLKPPLFTSSPQHNKDSSPLTDTQEVEAQLVNESTQFQAPSSEPSSSPIAETPQKMCSKTTFVPLREFSSSHKKTAVRPSQASTVDLTQPPTQTPTRPRSRNSEVEIVFESPVRSYPTSTPPSLPTPRRKNPEDENSDTLVPFSMASSQILTKSQLLPESLLTESVPPPPPFISDSDDDEDDDDYL